MERFILGSGSPRRRRLLGEAGFVFDVVTTDAPEVSDPLDPVGTVVANAISKNDACRLLRPGSTILTADTLVWFSGRLVGKPRDEEEAKSFLNAFSGKTQTVFTAVALSRPGLAKADVRVEATLVMFRKLSEAVIDEYVHLVRPLDRAGGYDIAEHGEMVVEEIRGSYTNVVGLPMETVRDMLA